MEKEKTDSLPETPELRKQAQEKRRKQAENFSELSKQEISQLIHELSIHQIELEMQNDELRKTQVQLQAAADEYTDLYDFFLNGLLENKEYQIVECKLKKRDDSERHVLLESSLIQETNDSQRRFRIMVRDISEQKEAEMVLLESEERFRTMAEVSHDLISTADENAHILWSNPVWKRCFGTALETLYEIIAYV